MRILVAEDDPIAQKLLSSILGKLGYDFVIAKDGSEAWETFKEAPFEICLIDWVMPEMSGVELCRRINQSNIDPDCQKIMLTAKGERDDLLEAMQAGANDYLIKPAEVKQLHLRLKIAELNYNKAKQRDTI